jgi:quercetin dioxygenase-like cupin family protein
MEVKRATAKDLGDHDHFSGKMASVPMASVAMEGAGPHAADFVVVSVDAGSVSDYHLHPGGQVLYVIEGQMVAADRAGHEHTLDRGDVAVTAPGEVHKHGAPPDTSVKLLAVSWGGTVWTED